MKFIGSIIGFALKLTLFAAGIVFVLEVIDRLSEKNRFRYTVSEDFEN